MVEVGSTAPWACTVGEGKRAPLLSPPSANLGSSLLPYNNLEQHWIACSQPTNTSETKEKHLPPLFFNGGYFLVDGIFFANMHKFLQNALFSSACNNVPIVDAFFFPFSWYKSNNHAPV